MLFFFPMNTSEMPTLKLQSLSARVFGEIRTETYNPSERQVEPQEFRIVYMCLIYIYLTRFSVTEIRSIRTWEAEVWKSIFIIF